MKQPKTPKPVRSSERVRLCVDCKHHYLAGYYMSSSADQYKCRAINPIVDMVTGKETPRMCSMMRNFKHMCGPDAKWFEAKEPNDQAHPMTAAPERSELALTDDAAVIAGAAPCSAIPRRPWLLSKQYSMTFVLSQDNDIIMGDTACKHLGDAVLRHIIAAVNAYSPNISSSATCAERKRES